MREDQRVKQKKSRHCLRLLDWYCCPSPSPSYSLLLSNKLVVGVVIIIMSSSGAETDVVCCANCGVAEVDGIQLEKCNDGCDLVLCGSKWCRVAQRDQHEEECQKHQAGLHYNNLFRQPERNYRGDCPLCFLPLPLDNSKSTFWTCCSKIICDGCHYAHHIKNRSKNCPFCRELTVCAGGESNEKQKMMKRIKAKDPAAVYQMGTIRYQEGNYDGAFEYWTKAAEMGDVDAHFWLGCMHWRGEGVEKDEEKAVYHLEKAAVDGHTHTRHSLGLHEWNRGKFDRAMKHFTIAANLGHEESMNSLSKDYAKGNITKQEFHCIIRTYNAAINAMKSPQREAAAAWQQSVARRSSSK